MRSNCLHSDDLVQGTRPSSINWSSSNDASSVCTDPCRLLTEIVVVFVRYTPPGSLFYIQTENATLEILLDNFN